MIFDRMDGCCENFWLIGIERDPDKVLEAGDKFGGSQSAFITGDVERSDFVDDLADKMDEMGIEKFDIVNLSMLLLHLKSECALLRRLRRLLQPEWTPDLYQPAQSRLQKDRIKKIWFYNHRFEL